MNGVHCGLNRISLKQHASLLRCPAAFAPIALVAGADHVLPNRYAALGTRNYVIEIEFLARQPPAAVLASQLIAGIDIKAAEANLAFGHAVVAHQQYHPRHANDAIDHADGLVVGGDRKIAPAVEIEGLILFVYRFGDALVEQHEGALHRGDMDRQVGPIEDQDLGVENRIT